VDEIFEEAPYTIQARITTGFFTSKPYTKTFDLLADINGTKTTFETDKKLGGDGTYQTTYTPRKVLATEKNYVLKIIAHYGSGKSSSTTIAKARVWPKVVKIHARNIKDRDYPGFDCAIEQDGAAAIPLTTNPPDGKVEATLSMPAPYKITCKAPFEILENVEKPDKRREHELKVVHNIKARFVTPNINAAPYVPDTAGGNAVDGVRQYVNLDIATDGSDALGSEVVCTVEADTSGPGAVPGKEGDQVFLRVTFGRESERNDPEPTLDQTGVEAYASAKKKTVHKGYVLLGADLKAKFKVKLGLAGGDTCTVEIGGTKDKYDDAKIILVNWRKLWYETRYPAAMSARLTGGDFPASLKTKVTERLAPVNLEYEMIDNHSYPDADCTPARQGGVLKPAAYFKEAGANRLVVSSFLLNVPPGGFSENGARRTRSVYISLCDRAFSNSVTLLPDVFAVEMDTVEKQWASPSDELMDPSPKDGTSIFKVAGGTPSANFKWKALIASPHMHVPTLTVNGVPDPTGAVAGTVHIEKTRGTASSLDVAFPAKTTDEAEAVSVLEEMPFSEVTPDAHSGTFETALASSAAIDSWVDGLLADKKELRKCGNELVVKIVGLNGTHDLNRFNAVKTALETRFNSQKAAINYHPGLDEDGNPREGDMDEGWFSTVDYVTFKCKLPTSPGPTAAYLKTLPGDFVGAAESDTECPVQIMFQLETAYEINGNSGDGKQLLCLRDTVPGPCSSTICHELGHAMGMTIVPGFNNDLLPPGLTAKHVDNGGTYYVNERRRPPVALTYSDGRRSLHKGGHCANTLPKSNRKDPTFKDWEPATGCIMWGQGGDDDSRQSFCDKCTNIIKARRLTDVNTPFDGRGADQG
jgi:hypothetical protein